VKRSWDRRRLFLKGESYRARREKEGRSKGFTFMSWGLSLWKAENWGGSFMGGFGSFCGRKRESDLTGEKFWEKILSEPDRSMSGEKK